MSMNGSVSEAGCKGRNFFITSKHFPKFFLKNIFSPPFCIADLSGLARKGCKGKNFLFLSKLFFKNF